MNINDVLSFAVYYGFGREDEIASFDLAVIEASGHENAALERLKRSGTRLLAYLSFIEVAPESSACSRLSENDFLKHSGRPVMNRAYNNLLADLGSEKWQSILMERITDLYLNRGFDGIFIDTLADIEYFNLPATRKNALVNSAVAFLRRLRGYFPELILVQNNGTEFLYHYTAGLLDGICVENPPAFDAAESEKLRYLKDKYNLTILMLTDGAYDPLSGRKVRAAAELNGFLYYHAKNGYMDL